MFLRSDLNRTTASEIQYVSNLVPVGNLLGKHSLYSDDGELLEEENFNSKHEIDGIKSNFKRNQDERVDSLYEHNHLISEKHYKISTNKLIKAMEFFPDGSKKSEQAF